MCWCVEGPRMLDSGFWMLNSQFEIQNSGPGIIDKLLM